MASSPGFGLKLITAPTWKPVSVGDLQLHARAYGNDDATNGVLQAYIDAAQQYVEDVTQRLCGLQQWLWSMDEFPGRQIDDYRPPTWRYGILRFPFSPLVSVDAVNYVDSGVSGAQPFPLTLLDPSLYQVDTFTQPGRMAPAPYQVWPVTCPLAVQAVQVTFTCGHTASDIPPTMVQAIKMIAAHLYDHRDATTAEALKRLPYGLEAMAHACAVEEYC